MKVLPYAFHLVYRKIWRASIRVELLRVNSRGIAMRQFAWNCYASLRVELLRTCVFPRRRTRRTGAGVALDGLD